MKFYFVITLLFIPILSHAQTLGPDLIINGGAETGDLTGWNIRSTIEGTYPSAVVQIDGTDDVINPPNHSGNHRFTVSYYYRFVCFFQYQTIDVIPGREYELGFSVTQRPGKDHFMSMYWFDGEVLPGFRPEDTPLQGMETTAGYAFMYGTVYSASNPTWVSFSGKTVRPSLNKMTVALYYRHVWESSPVTWHVDDIYAKEVLRPQPTPTPGGVRPGNLLINPGAETGDFSGWSWGGDTWPEIDPSVNIPSPPSHGGNHRFGWVTSFANNKKGYMYQAINTIPGHTYDFGLSFTQQDASDEYMDLYSGNDINADIWSHWLVGGGGNKQDAWRELRTSFTAQGTRTTILINFKHIWATNYATFHVDDVYVVDRDAPVATPTPKPGNNMTAY